MAKATNDRYTQFFTPDEFKAFNEALDPDAIGGIGVMIEPDATIGLRSLTYVLPGTPADRAGLQVGDVVTAIERTTTKGLSVDDASELLRGQAGTVVCGDGARRADRHVGVYDHARKSAAADGRLQNAAGQHRLRLGDGVRQGDARASSIPRSRA